MFKSRTPLQTPLLIRLLLSATVVTFFVGWSLTAEASIVENPSETLVAMSSENNELAQIAKSIHRQVNKYRASLDLAPLKLNPIISKQAKIHSENMAQQTVKFSHKGFEDRVEAIANSISYSSAAENLAYNMGYKDPADRAVAGWIESEVHRQNMIGNYNLTGIGVATNPKGEYYFTQIFILEN